MSYLKLTNIFLLFAILILVNGCATVLSSYEYTIDLLNAPEDIRVYDKNGVDIPVSSRAESHYSIETKQLEWSTIKMISLRKNKEHTLVLKSGDAEKRITVYPKIGAGWLIIDMVTGLFPVFIDAYTGNWHYFDDINVVFDK